MSAAACKDGHLHAEEMPARSSLQAAAIDMPVTLKLAGVQAGTAGTSNCVWYVAVPPEPPLLYSADGSAAIGVQVHCCMAA